MADFEQAGATERLRRVAILRDMQAKLKRSPLEALGVVAGAGPAEVRSAFMALTKQYHPAKFARLDEATVKLANEVFLDLREAYESLQAAATGKRARTIPGPGVSDAETPRKPEPAGQASAQVPPSSHANAGAPRPGQVSRPAEPARVEPRPAVGRAPLAGAASPSSSQPSSSQPSSSQPSSGAGSSAAGSSIAGRAASLHPAGSTSSASRAPGPAASAPAGPPTRPSAPSISTSTIASASGSVSGSSSAAASAAAATAAAKPAAAHSSTVPNTTGAPKIRFGNAEAPELVRIRGLINRQQWTDARNALQAMLQRVPTDRGSMAQLAYVRAREALELGNVSEARRELVRALAIEPTMEQARSALNELNDLNPSKPSSNPPAPRR